MKVNFLNILYQKNILIQIPFLIIHMSGKKGMQIFSIGEIREHIETYGCRLGKTHVEFECLSIFLPYFVHKLTSSLCTNVSSLFWFGPSLINQDINYWTIIFVIILYFNFVYVIFVYTVCTCSNIHLFCLKILNGTSLFFNLSLQPCVCNK